MKKADNRGMSLVELIVSIAIMAIVGSAILGFFLFSTKQYHRGSSESTLQNEAQMAMERLESLIVNASNGVGTDATGTELYLFNKEGTDICRRTRVYLDSANHQLVQESQCYSCTGGSFVPSGAPESTPIVDYVDTVFSVDLSDYETKQTVKITIGMKLEEQTYTTSEQFVLRNKVNGSTSAEPGEHFQ